MGPNLLEHMFNPRSLAVVGASDTSGSVGAQVFANILAAGFAGPVHPVNPGHAEVAGRPCFASISDMPEPVDLAVIATPAKTIPGIIHDCGEAGVRAAVVLSAGFGETGEEGQAREAELLSVARRAGVRFMGPNCVGLVRPGIGLNATFLKSSAPAGRLALVSQSGALCSAIVDWAGPHHLGFSAIVSLGNSANVDFGDVVDFLSTDPKTDAILLYVEGVRHARSFISALRVAARIKPVIVLKAGRHNESSKAAHTHTGALIGSDAVFDAVLERVGAVRAQTFGQLFAAAEILSTGKRANGPRLGIITNGGGAGVLAADRVGDLHVELPAPSPKTVAALDALLPPYWSRRNPVDILGDARPEIYAAAVKACIDDPNFDGVLVMLTPQAMTQASDAARALIDAVSGQTRKPVLACWMGEASVAEARTLLSAAGIPDFTLPERAVEAFSYLSRHHLNRRLALETPGPQSDLDAPDIEGARMIIDAVLADGRAMLSDIESKAVMRAFRIPVNVTLEAETPAKAVIAAETVGFPVAMKINSPQITHKSDVGGVRVNIMNAGDVQAAFREITQGAKAARPDATIHGVTVEPMAHIDDARELVVGVSRDPVFGPSIMFGAGGTMVEILQDNTVSLPPLNAVLANRQIDRARVSRLLSAFRDRPAVDRAAVVNVLLRISDLVCEFPEIEELDINPLFAGPDGVVAVDARIRVARPPARMGRHEHMAIVPYPRHLVRHEYLADGTPLTIRPIRPEDADSEQAFVRGLSAEARRMRFMYAMKELTPEMLVRFTQIDYSREMALVAMTQEAGGPVQQGVARYTINPDATSCEFAIVVSDSYQKQGIGTRLMKALLDAARDHGMRTIEGAVLAENEGMLQLMGELGFTIHTSPDDPAIMNVERWL
ncbi:MAG: bifunctional acetate--CoA ligase family protein/GNAT family N-acetyltransferase [Rhodobiaceae bacterium]|nr:bifunctional acetate--CoA ligase family protein/GNAT family N-acetyltransferase [Rhodobiaceae bacterium]MCC0041443.1 bifunctional acetate--CoA ligase family protein/GNAT family N-acetyltransferase [Rhodobiaceae bacterium]